MRIALWLNVMTGLTFLFASPLSAENLEIPDAIKKKYKYLEKEKLTKLPDGSLTFHKGRLFIREGIRLVTVSGDAYEMAYQHGRLLREEIVNGVVPEAAQLVPNIIKATYPERPLLAKIVQMYMQQTLINKNIKKAIKSGQLNDHMDMAYGLSASTGMSVKTILQAIVSPDALMILAARFGGAPISSSCTDFAAWGENTQDGDVIVGRNLDYPLNDSFDKYPTVIFFNPTGEQRYVAVGSAGIHNAGLSAFNESGIFVGAHTIPTTEVSENGIPAFAVAGQVVRDAKNFDEAIAIFKKFSVSSGYGYTLISAKEKKAATVEIAYEKVHVRMTNSSLHLQTNHYRHPEMADYNLYLNDGIKNESLGRLNRLSALLKKRDDKVDTNKVIGVLSDSINPFSGRVSGFADTIAVHTTVSSIVWEPEKKLVWVSNGKAPTSHGSFVSFPIFDAFDPDQFMKGSYGKKINANFANKYPKIAKAQRKYIEAKIAWETQIDTQTALTHLTEASKLDPETENYHIMRAIFALKLKKWDLGQNALEAVINRNSQSREMNLALYYRGRIFAHQGYAEEAIADFDRVLAGKTAGNKLMEAATKIRRKVRRKGFHRLRPKALKVMMQFADMQDYL